jgi:serine/threonine-protein kinase
MSAENATPPSGRSSPATGTVEQFDLSGKTLGEFQILRRLGKGGMAEVYLADQTTLQRQVAIKVLRPEFLADATYVKRFRHEATAAGGLNHPNIVQVYSIGEQDGLHYIAQEYVRGGNLREFMRRKGPLEVPIVLHILKQVAAALQVAGTSGIVHRDIKPENILLTKKGEVKVADFGLAQLQQQGERVALTQVGVTMGTPLYMSPEQVGGKGVDHRSDQYSFGAMAYHMLAGKPPFTGENALTIAVQHMNNEPKPLNDMRPDLPPALCELIHKTMAKKREDRYPDPQTLLGEVKTLQKLFTGKDGGTNHSASGTTRFRTTRRLAKVFDRPLRRQLGRMAIVALLLALMGAGIGWASRTQDPFSREAPADPAVKQELSIAAQYFAAMRSGDDEAAWKAVVNFPADPTGRQEMDRQSAELRLAIIYLQQGRRDKAEEIFNRFKAEGATNPWKKDHGLAGEAIIASLEGNPAQSKYSIEQLDRQQAKLDARFSLLVDEARVRNAAALKQP